LKSAAHIGEMSIPTVAQGAPASEPDLARLEDLLWRELDGYRDLVDIMLREKEVLTANQPDELPPLLEEQKRVLHDVKSLEPERAAALARVSTAVGAPAPLTLTELADRLDGESRSRVTKLRDALAHVVPRVDQVNRINVLLIRNSMSFISTTVRAILEEGTPRPTTYGRSGSLQANGAPPSSWTDRRA